MKQSELDELIREITSTEDYARTKHMRHHIRSNVYDHSLKVAELLLRHHKRFRTKTELRELIRGALLHDYYLYDRKKNRSAHRFHGWIHPRHALKNALRAYPDLSRTERDMIRRHMFPLTILPPKTSGGWLICFYDKIAAMDDLFAKKRKTKS